LINVLRVQSLLKNNGPVVVVPAICGSIDVLVARAPTILVEVGFGDGCNGLLIDELFDILDDAFHSPRLISQFGMEPLDKLDDHSIQTHVVQSKEFEFCL